MNVESRDILASRRIVLGVTGGIAAYKSATLASRLVQAGAAVDVILTAGAQRFVTPLTFQALTHRRVFTSLWDLPPGENIPHIVLADEVDLLIFAPTTANTLAKMANGLADNLLTSVALATSRPILIAPAMETDMWQHPATQRNVACLRDWGRYFVGPAEGRLASGAEGAGRMVEPEQILDVARHILAQQYGDLRGRHLVVTAGGTREAIDPVRFIGNRSSGKMGFALAMAARDRGATVTLISTMEFSARPGLVVKLVSSAAEMQDAVLQAILEADALIMAAAVADYRPSQTASQKIKKSRDEMDLPLVRTADILQSVSEQRLQTGFPRCVVGFAAETQDILHNAQEKLARKNLDFIVANDVSREDAGFAVDTNAVTVLSRTAEPEMLPLQSKRAVAEHILDRIRPLLTATNSSSAGY